MSDALHTLDDLNDPTLGVVVLQTDETIEQDFRHLLPPEMCKLHITRVASAAVLTPESILDMEEDLPRAVSLLPRAAKFDAVAYACTSGTAHIGANRVREIIMQASSAREVTDPMTAAIAALKAVDAKRIGVISPYSETVVQPLLEGFHQAGFEVARATSFNETVEENVVRISANALSEAASEIFASDGPDALFMSCTNLRTLDVIPVLEERWERPVIGSNLALAWHLGHLADLPAMPLRTMLTDAQL